MEETGVTLLRRSNSHKEDFRISNIHKSNKGTYVDQISKYLIWILINPAFLNDTPFRYKTAPSCEKAAPATPDAVPVHWPALLFAESPAGIASINHDDPVTLIPLDLLIYTGWSLHGFRFDNG